jgi:hypothetical protein
VVLGVRLLDALNVEVEEGLGAVTVGDSGDPIEAAPAGSRLGDEPVRARRQAQEEGVVRVLRVLVVVEEGGAADFVAKEVRPWVDGVVEEEPARLGPHGGEVGLEVGDAKTSRGAGKKGDGGTGVEAMGDGGRFLAAGGGRYKGVDGCLHAGADWSWRAVEVGLVDGLRRDAL